MSKNSFSKDEIIQMLIEKKLMMHIINSNLAKRGDKIRFAELFGIGAEDLGIYFETHGYPPIKDSDASYPPFSGEFKTVWTKEKGNYTAVWLERGTTSTLYSTTSREEFQKWWNENLIKEYEQEINYPWTV